MLAAAVGVNVLAYFHAGAMVNWVEGEARTQKPERLGLLQRLGVLLAGVSIPRPVNRLTPQDVGLAYETHGFPNGRGVELEAWYVPVEGAQVTSIVFHGYAGNKDTMLGVAKGLTQLGSSVLLVDFYGSGGSSGTGTSLGIHEAHDVMAAVGYARERWPGQALLLYGQSMGGATILRAVAKLGVAPDGIVLESTFDRLLATVESRFHRMGLPAVPFAQLLVFWGGLRIGGNSWEHNPADYARSVRCPTLVLQDDRDPNISSRQGRSIEAALGGWKRYAEYTKTGHDDIHATQPERWKEDVGALLAEMRG